MVTQPAESLLGVGLYTPAEAARYARIPSVRTASRWAHGTSQSEPVIRPQLEGDPSRTITFLDFVQLQAIRAIQLFDPQIKLPKIREAIEWVRNRHGIDYPLARKHKIIYHDGQIFVQVDGLDNLDAEDALYRQVTGRGGKDQTMIQEVAELYQRDLAYYDSGLPRRFRLFHRHEKAVMMDPEYQFGQPLLPSKYTLEAILRAVRTEGGREGAAKAYGLPLVEVDLAMECDDYLGLNAA